MNYAVGNAINLNDMFLDFDCKKMKTSYEKYKQLSGDTHRYKLAWQIFKKSYELVIKDIIENSVTFHLPSRPRKSFMYMKRVEGESFKKARQARKWLDVDFLASNFSGYQLTLAFWGRRLLYEKPVYVRTDLRDKIIKYTNEGKTYC